MKKYDLTYPNFIDLVKKNNYKEKNIRNICLLHKNSNDRLIKEYSRIILKMKEIDFNAIETETVFTYYTFRNQ